MRLFNLYFFCCLVGFSFCTKAQKKTEWDSLITIQFDNLKLTDCFEKLEKAYPVSFTYNNQNLEKETKIVSTTFQGKSLSFVVQHVLKSTELDFVYIGGHISVFKKKRPVTISGFIKDSLTREVLIGVQVFNTEPFMGTISNTYGFYSLSLPPGSNTVIYSFFGQHRRIKKIVLHEDTTINILLSPQITLEEVAVTAVGKNDVLKENLSVEHLNIDNMRKVPSVFGEPDVIRTIQMQPGIQTLGEVPLAYFVRGGSYSQNLVLLDDAPVYNPTHLFGMVSSFNNDMIKSADFYKGGIPAGYQSGASSVLDIRTNDGNDKSFHVNGSLGTLTAKLSLEGPIVKEKGSFFIAVRKSFLSDPFINSGFYDLNFKANYSLGKKDKIFLSGYRGDDKFRYDTNTTTWMNRTFSFRHTHVYTGKLFSNTSLVYSKFEVGNGVSSVDKTTNSETTQSVQNYIGKFVMSYFPRSFLTINAGAYFNKQVYSAFTYHYHDPTIDTTLNITFERNAFEAGAFAEGKINFGKRLILNAGVRCPVFRDNSAGTITYVDPVTFMNDSIKIKPTTYKAIEPRLSMQYMLRPNQLIKASYNHINQFQQQFIGGSLNNMAQVWLPSSSAVKPQIVDQVSLGYSLKKAGINFSVEFYYKYIQHVTDFKGETLLFGNDNPNFISIVNVESLLESGHGESYGSEFSITKTEGKLTGWCNYTYAKTMYIIPAFNNGKAYPSNFDNRHTISLGLVYDLTKKWSISSAFNYRSGRAFSFPDSYYKVNGATYSVVSERNKERTLPYHRLDLSIIYQPKTRKNKFKSTWIFSVVNVYNNFNPVYYTVDGNNVTGHALFPLLPFLSYNFKF